MASGPIVGGDDGTREKQRYTESKVYTRKAFKGPKNKANVLNTVATDTAAPTTANNDDNKNSTINNGGVNETEKNDTNVLALPPAQSIFPDENTAQPRLNSKLDVVSDDSSTLNRRQDEPPGPNPLQDEPSGASPRQDEPSGPSPRQDEPSGPNPQHDEPSGPNPHQDGPNPQQDTVPCPKELPSANGAINPGLENRIKINLGSSSKQEMQELRRRLERELDTVRSLVRRIEMKQRQLGGYGNSNMLANDRIGNTIGPRRVLSGVASGGVPRESARPLHQLSISVLENCQGVGETVEKEKRTPKANQLYSNSEFLLGKDKFPPAESNKKSKLNGKKQGGGEMGHGFGMGSKFFKSCSSLLEKLMKHKHGWVFNAPVDVEGLGLHDYFSIITHPMDLGTVKTRLSKNWYKSPKEFAEDVRLTFRNAMTYNPPGQDVHIMAEQLSKIFEDRWAIIESDYNREMRYVLDYGTTVSAPSPLSRRAATIPPPALDMRRILDRSESMTQPPRPMSITPSSRTPAPKKPKAKDPYKRDMTYEEKQKLSTSLQNLPPEKLDTIVQIIKKRNSALSQHDDEIEVDIDSVDAETLWELDRFVTNFRKSLSKNKRKAELAIQRAEAAKNAPQMALEPAAVVAPQETIAGERNASASFPSQAEKQVNNGSRSSSSSSSSSDSGSSSSDSDSESSSASGSDAGSPRT
ncbi:transcription factor GTE4 [Neltuma alba]|uniref:transcription factor GTE4 n=1 Tax=Neltuma alba TaxID=207710 RepID=UPI0010A388F7|nr:transcription factor GTE4-like [Prosopis alba]XP_028807816.1 transcription factor GTE4-like [Prosopis alba]